MLELSEPDWCKYHVKVATKHLCGKGNVEKEEKVDDKKIICSPKVLESTLEEI